MNITFKKIELKLMDKNKLIKIIHHHNHHQTDTELPFPLKHYYLYYDQVFKTILHKNSFFPSHNLQLKEGCSSKTLPLISKLEILSKETPFLLIVSYFSSKF